MAQAIPVTVTPEEREQLEAVSRSRLLPHGIVRRAKIILGLADGVSAYGLGFRCIMPGGREITLKAKRLLMAAWLVPALKAIAPHVGTIINAAAPVFTRKRSDEKADLERLIQKQIVELQDAASRNVENTRELAEQLQDTVKALEQAAMVAQSKFQYAVAFSVVSVALSVVAVSIALIAIFNVL